MFNNFINRKSLFILSSLFISTATFVTAADLNLDGLTRSPASSKRTDLLSPPTSHRQISPRVSVDGLLPEVSPRLSPRLCSLKPSSGESLKWIKEREKEKQTQFNLKFVKLPPKIDFSDELPPLHDQGQLGSCTAQAITLAMEYDLKKAGNYTLLSPLYVYYNEREMEGTVERDDGASLADGLKTICVDGACKESTWSYEDLGNKFKTKPPIEAYEEGKSFLNLDNIGHSRIPHNLRSIKTVLATKVPVVFGIMIYPSLDNAIKGHIPMPSPSEEPVGGHALTLVGYDDENQEFKFANSWGHEWGDKGCGYLTYDYIMNKARSSEQMLTYPNDFWSITEIGRRV